MKSYYRKKGNYNDGRSKIVIEFIKEGKIKSCTLPKPEKMLKILGQGQVSKNSEEKHQ